VATTLIDGRIFQTIVPLQRYTIPENYVWIRRKKSHKLDVKTDIYKTLKRENFESQSSNAI
jgi:hypothetical protein